MKMLISLIMILLIVGCGVHAELEKPDGTKIYYNRGWLSPENVTIKAEGFEVTIGEQAAQKAMIESLIKLGITIGSGATVP